MILKELLTLREYEFPFEYKKSKECRNVEAPELEPEMRAQGNSLTGSGERR